MKKTKKKTKKLSTFEREMQNAKFKAAFEQEYQEFALQELLAAMSQGDEKSVRALAKAAGLHPNAVQNLRSGKTTDIKLSSFLKIVKGDVHIPVPPKTNKPKLAY